MGMFQRLVGWHQNYHGEATVCQAFIFATTPGAALSLFLGILESLGKRLVRRSCRPADDHQEDIENKKAIAMSLNNVAWRRSGQS